MNRYSIFTIAVFSMFYGNAHANSCYDVTIPTMDGKIQTYYNCLDSSGNMVSSTLKGTAELPSEEKAAQQQVIRESMEYRTQMKHDYQSYSGLSVGNNENVKSDCQRTQDWVIRESQFLPRTEGGLMEIRSLSADCNQRLFTYNVRLLLDNNAIQNTPNFSRDLRLSTLDGNCDDEFIIDKGWKSKTIVVDQNYSSVSQILISGQDCKIHKSRTSNPYNATAQSEPPKNMQELSDRINQAIPGIAGDMVKGMFGDIFGGGGNSSQGRGQECLPQQVCDAYGNCRKVYGGNSC